MGIFDRLFRKAGAPSKKPPPTSEHAVLVRFPYDDRDLSRLFELEEQLEESLAEAAVGELDGNEVGTAGEGATLFLYGPDADALFAAIRTCLESSELAQRARITLRYGPPEAGVREVHLALGP